MRKVVGSLEMNPNFLRLSNQGVSIHERLNICGQIYCLLCSVVLTYNIVVGRQQVFRYFCPPHADKSTCPPTNADYPSAGQQRCTGI